jgi:hypothetical protein
MEIITNNFFWSFGFNKKFVGNEYGYYYTSSLYGYNIGSLIVG